MEKSRSHVKKDKIKILVCDDHRDITILMQRILKKSEYNVLCAFSSEECIKVFDENSDDIKLIIMDINIPSITGADLARMLNKKKPDVKILLTSGHCLEILKSRHEIDDNFYFIGKPFGPAELRRKVAEILEESN